jgi:RHS repeat-associated protein
VTAALAATALAQSTATTPSIPGPTAGVYRIYQLRATTNLRLNFNGMEGTQFPHGCYKITLSQVTSGTTSSVFYISALSAGRPYPMSLSVTGSPYSTVGIGTYQGVVMPNGSGSSLTIAQTPYDAIMTVESVSSIPIPPGNTYGWGCAVLPVTPIPQVEPSDCATAAPPVQTGDPIDLRTGELFLENRCLSLGGAGLPINVGLRYSSRQAVEGRGASNIGPGWFVGQQRHLSVTRSTTAGCSATESATCQAAPDTWHLATETGEVYSFTAADAAQTTFNAQPGSNLTLTRSAVTGQYTVTYRNGLRDIFAASGERIRSEDRFGNALAYAFDSTTGVQTLTNLRTGQALRLEHSVVNGAWRLHRIADAASNGSPTRQVLLGYDASGNLTTLTDAAGRRRTFGYDSLRRITTLYDANNDPAVLGTAARATSTTYDADFPARVVRQVLAHGTTIDLTYTGGGVEVTYQRGQPNARTVTYGWDKNNTLKSISLPNRPGVAATFFHDFAGRLVQSYDPMGRRTIYTYDSRGDLIAVEAYTSSSTVDRTQYTYDAHGALTSRQEPAGALTRWSYDATTGALTHITREAAGVTQVTQVMVDATGQVTQVTLPDGTHNTVSYDALGYPRLWTYDANVGGATGRLALTEETVYSWQGQLLSRKDRQGVQTTYEYAQSPSAGQYGTAGLPSAVIVDSATGGRQVRTALTYDAMGNLLRQVEDSGTGRLNRTTSYQYAPVGTEAVYATTQVTDALGQVTRLAYSTLGELTSVTQVGANAGADRTTRFTTTPEGWLASTTLHDGRVVETVTYNDAGQPVRVVDAAGVETTYAYDGKGRLAQRSLGTASASLVPEITRYTYDANDRLTRVTVDLDGGTQRVLMERRYDLFNRLLWTKDGAGNQSSATYDSRDHLIRLVVSTAAGVSEVVTEYGYDALGRRTRQVVDPGTGRLNLTTQYRYTTSGSSDRWNLQEVVDPRGARTLTRYNTLGWLSQTVDALNGTWSYAYDNLGALTTVTPPLGAVSTYTVDLLGRPTRLGRNGQTESWSYNVDGTLKSTVDFAGRVATYGYDGTGRLTSIDRAGTNADAQFTYTANDRLASATSMPDGVTSVATSYTYDMANRLRTRARGGRAVTYGYTAAGDLASLDYWGRGSVSHGYDTAGRVSSLTPWGGAASSFSYRATGQLASVTRPSANGIQTAYEHDTAGRLTRLAHTRGTTNVHTLTYALDANGNRTQMTDQWGTTSYSYDVLNRLTQAQLPAITGGPVAQTVGHTYDAVGNRLSGNPVVTTSTGWRRPGAQAAVVAGSGDNNGLEGTPANALSDDGLLASDTNSGTTTSTLCGDAGKDRHRFTTFNVALPASAVVTGIEVVVQARADSTVGSPRYCVELSGDNGATWTAPKQTPVLGTTETSHILGSASDLWGRSWTPTSLGNASFQVRLTAVSSDLTRDFFVEWVAARVGYRTSTYAYDASDRLAMDAAGFQYDMLGNLKATPDGTTYTYDAANRLVQTVKGTVTTTYQYDALGHLVRRAVNGVATDFVLDEGGRLPRLLGEVQGTTETLYAHGPDGLHAQRQWLNGVAQGMVYPLGDGLGSVRNLTDASGVVTRSVSYDAWGVLRHATGTAPAGASGLGYTGEQQFGDGIVHLRARAYAPQWGRFLQRDTFAGFPTRPQSLHRYAYTENNPVNWTDPSGRWVETAFDVISAALSVAEAIHAFRNNCSDRWWTLGAAALDVASAALPFIPAAAGHARRANRALDALDTAGDGRTITVYYPDDDLDDVQPLPRPRPPPAAPTIAEQVPPERIVPAPDGLPEGMWYGVRNDNGGTDWVSTEPVTARDVEQLAQSVRENGPVRILTGTHGTRQGELVREPRFYREDIEAVRNDPRNGMGARDIHEMSEAAQGRYLNSPNQTILGWCYSQCYTNLPNQLRAGQVRPSAD